MVIDKQAYFVVRMAKNLELKSPDERKQVLAAMPKKTVTLVNAALLQIRKNAIKRREPNDE